MFLFSLVESCSTLYKMAVQSVQCHCDLCFLVVFYSTTDYLESVFSSEEILIRRPAFFFFIATTVLKHKSILKIDLLIMGS